VEVERFSEASVTITLHSHCCENLKSQMCFPEKEVLTWQYLAVILIRVKVGKVVTDMFRIGLTFGVLAQTKVEFMAVIRVSHTHSEQ
jgi:hypothetical protein